LKSILFTEEPTVTKTGKVPVWRPGALVNSSSGDIIILEANKSLTRRLPNETAMTMPFQVDLSLDVQGCWQDIRHRFHTSVRSYDLRLVRKYGYDYCVSHDEQSFDMFYQTMYLPTLLAKYDKLASPTPVEQARQYLRHGLLVLIKRDGQYVSGSLCSIQRETISPRLIGVINADKQLIKEGAQGAAYYAMIHWANQQGFSNFDFGSCWPYMESVMYYKRKWGAAASIASRHDSKRIWIKVQRNTPAVFRFLSANPGVIIDQKGELRVLIVTEDPSKSLDEVHMRWDKFYAMPGISGPLICTVEDLLDNQPMLLSQQRVLPEDKRAV
jgi:hypothetical protein